MLNLKRYVIYIYIYIYLCMRRYIICAVSGIHSFVFFPFEMNTLVAIRKVLDMLLLLTGCGGCVTCSNFGVSRRRLLKTLAFLR